MKIRPDHRHLRKQLYKLLIAEFSMLRVRAFAQQLIKENFQQPNLTYRAFITAIRIEYGRPFAAGSNSNLGSVSSNFEKFSDPVLKTTHTKLGEARNDLYAHYSAEHQYALLKFVTKVRDGVSGFEVYSGRADDHIHPVNLPLVEELADFQANRFNAEGKKVALEILKQLSLSPGEYRIDPHGDMTLIPHSITAESIEWFE